MRYSKNGEIVEAITFHELIEYGKVHADSMVNGVPWSFDYHGARITHETDSCYLLPLSVGADELTMHHFIIASDLVVTDDQGKVYAVDADEFLSQYKPVEASLFGTSDG